MCYARRQRSSWARIKLSKSLYQNTDPKIRDPIFLLSSFALSIFYFCLSSILVRIVRDPFAHTFICFVLLSCCSIFKDHLASAIAATFKVYHIPHRLSIPFLKLFSSFSSFFACPVISWALRFWVSPIMIPQTTFFVKHFFEVFFIFLIFGKFEQFHYDIPYDILI